MFLTNINCVTGTIEYIHVIGQTLGQTNYPILIFNNVTFLSWECHNIGFLLIILGCATVKPTISYEEIATKLLNEKLLLTALELHAELCEAGKELPILREFFSNPNHFESQSIKPEPYTPMRMYKIYVRGVIYFSYTNL